MRVAHTHLNLSDHPSRWWLGHAAVTIAAIAVLLYAAVVLLVLVSRMWWSAS